MLSAAGLWSWFHFWLGIDLAYIISFILVAGGAYVAFALGTANALNPISKLLRDLGIGTIVIGLLLAWGTYKESIGAADCEARWKAANYQATIDKLKREAKIAADREAQSEKEANDLARQADAANQKVADYEKTLANSPACVLTGDDLERLRSIR